MNKKLGLGKVLSVSGQNVTAFFKDQKENPRTINVSVVPMPLATDQNDPLLDDVDSRGKRKSRARKPAAAAAAPSSRKTAVAPKRAKAR